MRLWAGAPTDDDDEGPAMSYVQDPFKQVGYLQQCLSSDKKPLGLFLGAACPMAVKAGDDNSAPLIPDIAGITGMVRNELSTHDKCAPLLKIVEKHFADDGRDETNVEDMLSHVRDLRRVAGKGKVRDLCAQDLDTLDGAPETEGYGDGDTGDGSPVPLPLAPVSGGLSFPLSFRAYTRLTAITYLSGG